MRREVDSKYLESVQSLPLLLPALYQLLHLAVLYQLPPGLPTHNYTQLERLSGASRVLQGPQQTPLMLHTHILREEDDDGAREAHCNHGLLLGVMNATTNQILQRGRSLWPLDQSVTRWNFDLNADFVRRASLKVLVRDDQKRGYDFPNYSEIIR